MTLIYDRSRMLLTMNALQKIKRECTVVYVTLIIKNFTKDIYIYILLKILLNRFRQRKINTTS